MWWHGTRLRRALDLYQHVGKIAAILCMCVLLLASNPVLAETLPSSSEVCGYVWHDLNEDRARDETELPLGDVLIVLASPAGKVLDHTYTDATGEYHFVGLGAGSYVLCETDPAGFGSTTPNVVPIELSDQEHACRDFGDTRILPGCFRLVDGFVWHDADGDGERDEGEQVLPGVSARVLDLDHNLVGLTTSDEYGAYTVRGLDPAQYHVVLDAPDTMPASSAPLYWGVDLQGCHPAIIDFGLQQRSESDQTSNVLKSIAGPMNALRGPDSSSAKPIFPFHSQGTLAEAMNEEGNSSVSGTVWSLEAHSGDSPPDRRAVPGIKLTLTDSKGNLVAEQHSDSLGRYQFQGLTWQNYHLTQESIADHEPVSSLFWGVVATDASDVRIDFGNRLLLGQTPSELYIPLISSAR